LVQALLNSAPWWAWLGFHLLVFLMLALDLGIFNRDSHAPSAREAGLWSLVWISLALLFNGVVWYSEGGLKAAEFLTGYLLEKSLSVDNLFVFVLLFTAFQVPARNQHRILYWGVLGALIMRAAMILAGTALLHRFEWMIFVFGGFLVFTGVKMLVMKEDEPADPRHGAIARVFQRFVPYDPDGGFSRFRIRVAGRHLATPMLLVLVIVEVTDLIFAVDSIPAVLAVTRDPFIVYTSNIFAILGLRSLYFLLARMIDRFHYLKLGLAIILTFVGVKMCIATFLPIPIHISLLVIALVLAGCIAASLLWPKAEEEGL
jgi:tellurite resistance protein TerC